MNLSTKFHFPLSVQQTTTYFHPPPPKPARPGQPVSLLRCILTTSLL